MNKWHGITGSAAGDTAACPPRAAFPQARVTGEWAERGTELHLFAQRMTLHPERREEWLADVPEDYRHTAEGMNLDKALDGITVKATEIAYVVDVKARTARCLGENRDRDYGELGPWEIPLTIDLEGEVLDGIPCELDYKSGQSIGNPEDHYQRRLSAAALMFHKDKDEAISRVGYIDDNGDIRHDGCTFTLIDAWEICDVMVKAIEAVHAARAKLAIGEIPTVFPDREKQCRYCNAFVYCPYWNSLIKGADERLAIIGPVEEIPIADKGKVFDYVKDVLKAFELLEKQLREHALRQPLPVDDQTEYSVATKKGRSYFDAAAARGLLITTMSKLGASDEEITEKMNSLNKRGRDVEEVRKRKRTLPVVVS